MAELLADAFHLAELMHLLDEGWCVEEPVLQHSGADGRGCCAILEVVLHKDDERRVVALGSDLPVWEFLEQRKLAILDV
jgi:hypothetical protein